MELSQRPGIVKFRADKQKDYLGRRRINLKRRPESPSSRNRVVDFAKEFLGARQVTTNDENLIYNTPIKNEQVTDV